MTIIADARRAVELEIGGMTCASCAARVEKKLNELGGVTATVNFATGAARVAFPPGITTRDLIFSPVFVVTNSLRLRRFRPGGWILDRGNG